ncbi:MAG: hypothetical protein RL701_2773 [Pseudomonadota bacterium]
MKIASATLASLCALTSIGCASGSSNDVSASVGTAGSAGRLGAPAGTGSGGVGYGSGTAGRLGTSSAGTTGGGGRGPAGSGSPNGAGSRAAGSGGMGGAGARAPGSGGAGAVASAAGADASAPSSGQIWQPKPGATWQWQLTGKVDTSVDAEMYDIDLFTNPAATIDTLHAAGRVVICYFSAGTYEPDRPDSDALAKTGLGSVLDGWPDEKWLDIRLPAVRDLMKARLDLAKEKGCDGMEPDNVDGFDNDNGLGLTEKDALDYDKFLATESHARGLSVGLKNSLGLAASLVSSFDWALDEECLQYDECDSLVPFISAGKAVFHCEYAKSTNGICGAAPAGFSTIVKNLDLDAFRLTCN